MATNSNDFDYININLDCTESDLFQTDYKKEPNTSSRNEVVNASSKNETVNTSTSSKNGTVNVSSEANSEAANASTASAKAKPNKKSSIYREVISYVLVVVAAFVLALLTNSFLIVNARIPTGSMVPTIKIGDRIIGNRLAYVSSEPKRGDVVVFYYPDNEKEKFVKRIIGLPGETVSIINGTVYIDGVPLDESAYISAIPYGTSGPYVVPEGCYFMLGDNRNSSHDSRLWDNKYVKKEKIIAKAIFSYFPKIKKIK